MHEITSSQRHSAKTRHSRLSSCKAFLDFGWILRCHPALINTWYPAADDMSDCLSKGWQAHPCREGRRRERRGSQKQQQQHGVKVEEWGSPFFLCLSFPFPLCLPVVSQLPASLPGRVLPPVVVGTVGTQTNAKAASIPLEVSWQQSQKLFCTHTTCKQLIDASWCCEFVWVESDCLVCTDRLALFALHRSQAESEPITGFGSPQTGRRRRVKSFARMSWCFLVFNCKSSGALTGIMVQANEDECFPFTSQSPALYVCVWEREEILCISKFVCDRLLSWWLEKDVFVVAFLLGGFYSEHCVHLVIYCGTWSKHPENTTLILGLYLIYAFMYFRQTYMQLNKLFIFCFGHFLLVFIDHLLCFLL